MNQNTPIAFTKMNGLGNDFVVIDARTNRLALTDAQVRALAARDNDVTKGCDQVLVLHPSQTGNCFMQIFNADGGEVEACGNGARAVAAYLTRPDETGHHIIETKGGTLETTTTSGDEETAHVLVIMPPPKFGWQDIPLSREIGDISQVQLHDDLPPAFLVNVGNPHAVFYIDGDPYEIDGDPYEYAKKYGPELVNHPLFPEGANINFAVLSNDYITLQTYERGAGLTKACGTGACATAIFAIKKGYSGFLATLQLEGVRLDMPGIDVYFAQQREGENARLSISYMDNKIITMAGSITFEFDGQVRL